jgi:hypothetical protein
MQLTNAIFGRLLKTTYDFIERYALPGMDSCQIGIAQPNFDQKGGGKECGNARFLETERNCPKTIAHDEIPYFENR